MKIVNVAAVEAILKDAKVKNAAELFEQIIAQSREQSFGASANPPKEIDGVTHYYCRYTAKYYPLEQMVVSNGKSKGYSKIGISAWTKVNAAIKKLDAQIADCLRDDTLEKAKELNIKRQMLKDALNQPSTYENIVDGKVQLSIL